MEQIFILALCACLVLAQQPHPEQTDSRIHEVAQRVRKDTIESLPYGVLMKKVAILDLSSSKWGHIFKVRQLEAPPLKQIENICAMLPSATDLQARLMSKEGYVPLSTEEVKQIGRIRDSFCFTYRKVYEGYKLLLNKTNTRGTRLYANMKAMTHGTEPTIPSKDRYKYSADQAPCNLDELERENHGDKTLNFSTLFNDTDRDPHCYLMRRQRRFLQFIGETTGHFFGLATVSDVMELQEAVTKINSDAIKAHKEFKVFRKDMVSVLDLHWRRMNLFSDTINKTLVRINRLHEHLNAFKYSMHLRAAYNKAIHNILLHTFMDVSVLQNAMTIYQGIIQDRITALAQLNQHILSPELIDMATLRTALDRIEPTLFERYAPFRFAFQDLSYFYAIPSTNYIADDKYLYVEIKVPLTVMASNYHVYEIFSVPLRASHRTTEFTQIKNLNAYGAFSTQGDTYTSLGQRFLDTCVGVGIKRCPTRLLEVSTSEPSCILGLFLQDRDMIDTHCIVELILAPTLPETALDIGQGKFFISMTQPDQNWVIACPHARPRSVKPCASCVVSLDCRCSLKTASAFISASLQQCANTTTTSGISRSYIPNLSWISRIKNFSISFNPAMYNMTSEFDHDLLSELPPLPLPDYREVAEFAEQDTEIRTNLDTVLERVKKHEPVYVTKIQEFTSKALKIYHALPIAIAGIVWCLALTVALVIIGRKYSVLLAILTQSEPSEALDPNEVMSTVYVQEVLMWYIAASLTLFYVVKITQFVLNKVRQSKLYRKYYPLHDDEPVTTKVSLKLCTGLREAILHMDHLRIPHHLLQVANPMGDTLKIVPNYSTFGVELNLTWEQIVLQDKVTKMSIPLRRMVHVPRKIRYLVHTLLKDPNLGASVVLQTGFLSTDTPVPLGTTFPGINLDPPPCTRFSPRPPKPKRSKPSPKTPRPKQVQDPRRFLKRKRQAPPPPEPAIQNFPGPSIPRIPLHFYHTEARDKLAHINEKPTATKSHSLDTLCPIELHTPRRPSTLNIPHPHSSFSDLGSETDSGKYSTTAHPETSLNDLD